MLTGNDNFFSKIGQVLTIYFSYYLKQNVDFVFYFIFITYNYYYMITSIILPITKSDNNIFLSLIYI